MSSSASESAELAFTVDFLERVAADRAAGRERTVAEYEALFPGREQQVLRQWQRLQQPEQDGAADALRGAAPATRRLGPFQLERELGRGGQAVVHLARDTRSGEMVALKVFRLVAAHGAEAWLRFRREVEVVSRLQHAGICPLRAAGDDGEFAWIAMAFVAGEPLAARIEAAQRALAAFVLVPGDAVHDQRAIAAFGAKAAAALHFAHEAGVVHRDVKPGNLMVTPAGEPVLLDFGLASADQSQLGTLTADGDVFGTPAYMAPEQIRGERHHIDRRTDVYGLGAALYEAVTWQRPFTAATREALYRSILTSEPVPAHRLRRAVHRDFAVVLATALAKEPDRRYRTAADLAEDLRRVAAGVAILARPPGPWRRLATWARRHPGVAAALTLTFVTLLAGLAVSLVLLRSTERALLLARVHGALRAIPYLEGKAEVELWPALPSAVPAMQAWLQQAAALSAEGGQLRQLPPAALVGLGTEGRDALAEFERRLPALVTTQAAVQARLHTAAGVAEATLQTAAAAWSRAIAAIAAEPRYDGLQLRPQLGLVPLGADPASGLQEFWHWASGAVPQRGPDGRLLLAEDAAIVLVLVPGGHGGGLTLDLGYVAPFFLGKHEVTQAQWERLSGGNPSSHPAGTFLAGDVGPVTLRHPVDHVSKRDAALWLPRHGLELPTVTQWVWACQAGGSQPYHSGDTPESLQDVANICDRAMRALGEGDVGGGWGVTEEVDDGFPFLAPVGSFAPNVFGLHDMHGNVYELCADVGGQGRCVLMGGSFQHPAQAARADLVKEYGSEDRSACLGLRVCRPIE